MVAKGQPQKAGSRRLGLVIATLKRAWNIGLSGGPEPEPSALDHPPMACSSQKGGHPRAYSRELPDEFAEPLLKSETYAT
jgi:hypothetical protein